MQKLEGEFLQSRLLQDLAHFLLDFPVLEPLRRAIFGSTLTLTHILRRCLLLGLFGVPFAPSSFTRDRALTRAATPYGFASSINL